MTLVILFEKFHGNATSISCEKVGGFSVQRVISEAHVPGNDKFQMISSYGEML